MIGAFFGLYSSLAQSEHYAFSKIAQYFPALSVVGRIDLVFVYLLSIVLLFYTCLPLQYTTNLLADIFGTKRKTLLSALLNFFFFLGVLFLNKYYDTIHNLISGNLFLIFILIADMVPLFLLFLPNSVPKKTKKSKVKEKKKAYA